MAGLFPQFSIFPKILGGISGRKSALYKEGGSLGRLYNGRSNPELIPSTNSFLLMTMKTNTITNMIPEAPENLPPMRNHHFSLAALASMPWSLLRALPAIGVALWTPASALAQTTYTLTQISPPPGADYSTVESVNNYGRVVGNTKVKAGRSNIPGPAFVWQNGAAVSLPSLGADRAAQAYSISDSGLIVGHSPSLYVYDPNSPPKAVWWQLISGKYQVGDWNTLLPETSRLFLTAATAISHDGQFVVFDSKDKDSGLSFPVVAQIGAGGTSMTTWTLNISPDGSSLYGAGAGAIDYNEGTGTVRVVGSYAKTATDASHAYLWEMNSLGQTMLDINGNQVGARFPRGVNGAGQIIGFFYTAGVYQGHFWDRFDVQSQQLPTLGGGRTIPTSINVDGLVTGSSSRSGRNALDHAFLWDISGGLRDLNALKPTDTSGIELTKGQQINDAGQILAFGLRKGIGYNVLLRPVSP